MISYKNFELIFIPIIDNNYNQFQTKKKQNFLENKTSNNNNNASEYSFTGSHSNQEQHTSNYNSLTEIETKSCLSSYRQDSLTKIQDQSPSQQNDYQKQTFSQEDIQTITKDTENSIELTKSISNISNKQEQDSQNNKRFNQQKEINKSVQNKIHKINHIKNSIINTQYNQFNFHHNQYKKLQGLSGQNRIFPVNNLIQSSKMMMSSSTNIFQKNSSAKVLRLLKKDLNSFPSMIDSQSTFSSIPNIPTNNENIEEETEDPNKIYESTQVTIDESNLLETRIHEWLDNEKIIITCPSSKMHDYFDQIRQKTFQDIQSIILQSESDLDFLSTPSTTCSQNYLNHSESPLPFTPTPRIEKRQLTSLLPNCGFLNRRRVTLKTEEKKEKLIEERDEWDQD